MLEIDATTRLWTLVERRATATPGAEMLVDGRGRRLTFRAFRDRAERTAFGLAAHGVRPGTPVGWQLPTVMEALVLTAALARLDAVQSPLMPAHGERELTFVLGQTAARYFIVAESWRGHDLAGQARRVAAHRTGPDVLVLADGVVPELDPAAAPAPLPPLSRPAPATDDAVRWVFYTSATTAEPKGARHTDASVLASARATGERLACTPSDRVGLPFPVAHIGGCGSWLGACLLFGCTLVLESDFDPERTAALLRRERITVAGAGAVFIQAYLDVQRRAPQRPVFPELRVMTAGGSPKPAALHAQTVAELGGAGVLSGYGMTEAPVVTMGALTDPDDVLARSEGRPTRGVELRIVAPDGRILGPGEEGEIRVRGQQVMRGYVDATLDRDAFDADGYLRSGDLGWVDALGYLTVTGRLKDVIIRKGENISAKALEDALLECPAVADVAVIGLPDVDRGELACAVVVPADTDRPPTLASLTQFLTERGLAPRQLPEQLEIVAALPRNDTGKVLKTDLRRWHRSPAAHG